MAGNDIMLLIRFAVAVLLVAGAAVLALVADAWWLVLVAILLVIGFTLLTVAAVFRYAGVPEWLGAEDEAELEEAHLVEPETGLPKQERFSSRRAAAYAEEVARRGLVAVPDGWRGPEGAHRVLLVATAPVTARQLRDALPDSVASRDLAVLVVVPALSRSTHRSASAVREAVQHAEEVAQSTVAALRAAGVSVSGHIGPADPAVALGDGLRTYDAERVLVMRDHDGERRPLEDVPVDEAARAFHVPLTEATVGTGR
jgi:hypothetical protein